MVPQRHTTLDRSHVVVLKQRSPQGARTQNNGLKQDHSVYARGSPPPGREMSVRRPTVPPPREGRHVSIPYSGYIQRGEDLGGRLRIDNYLGRMVARSLIWMLLLQPVYVAFGMEVGAGESQGSAVSAAGEVPDSGEGKKDNADMHAVESEGSVADVGDSTAHNDAGEEPVAASGAGDVAEAVAGVSDEGAAVSSEEIAHTDDLGEDMTMKAESAETGDNQEPSTDTDAVSGGEGTVDDLPIVEVPTTGGTSAIGPGASSSDAVSSEGATESGTATSTDVGTTTDEFATSSEGELPEATIITQNPQSKYVFGEGDCTLVADGQFYCVAAGPTRQQTGDPRVYAEKDREGDREIYYFDGVDVYRVTNNGYDDFAPVFDEDTQRIVWQASINDRMQIMVYEIPTHTTRQITTGHENSSNPDIEGDMVVWQRWVGTNWEVMMTNVHTEGAPFVVEQLTDNAVHDMFPRLYSGYVTWQREKGSSWEVVLYDLETGKTRALEKNENTKYENPRFVLLFDSKHENGDVETVGYDLGSGEMMELGTKANREPVAPVSPKDKVPDAPVSTASTTQVKVGKEEDTGGDPTL